MLTNENKRGRPSTGQAMSNAERQKRWRDMQKLKICQLEVFAQDYETSEILNLRSQVAKFKSDIDDLNFQIQREQQQVAYLTKQNQQLKIDYDELYRLMPAKPKKSNVTKKPKLLLDDNVSETNLVVELLDFQPGQLCFIESSGLRHYYKIVKNQDLDHDYIKLLSYNDKTKRFMPMSSTILKSLLTPLPVGHPFP